MSPLARRPLRSGFTRRPRGWAWPCRSGRRCGDGGPQWRGHGGKRRGIRKHENISTKISSPDGPRAPPRTGTRRRAGDILSSSGPATPRKTVLVGTTGVEPARIAPRDPKSRASANSATCPSLIANDLRQCCGLPLGVVLEPSQERPTRGAGGSAPRACSTRSTQPDGGQSLRQAQAANSRPFRCFGSPRWPRTRSDAVRLLRRSAPDFKSQGCSGGSSRQGPFHAAGGPTPVRLLVEATFRFSDSKSRQPAGHLMLASLPSA